MLQTFLRQKEQREAFRSKMEPTEAATPEAVIQPAPVVMRGTRRARLQARASQEGEKA